ncbi:hypothetical protein ElyMa_004236000 [Elysia marginata]|uniref:Uncharacterized protein n=1 Tax=Elysia marginata TaxID=1093978 RepID=A0AAV4GR90_9GAST|nr:hypothetical protein ElyMa_004236000 [Elysia marginata]
MTEAAFPAVSVLRSIIVSIPACHAGDRGSIPRRGEGFFTGSVALIQRAWREYLRSGRKQTLNHSPSTSSPLSSPSSSSSRSTPTQAIIIDDAVHSSPLSGGKPTTTATTTTSVIESNIAEHSIEDILGIESETDTTDTISVKRTSGGIDKLASSVSISAGQGPRADPSDVSTLTPPADLSDHDDETSETESAIIGCAMTLLTPEENQGGGEQNTGTFHPTHNDDDTEGEEEVAEEDSAEVDHHPRQNHHQTHHHQQQPQPPPSSYYTEGTGSIPTSDPEDISPVLPQITAPVPGIQPVLDSQAILSSLDLEEDQAREARDSPSRSSLGPGVCSSDNTDARSVASSDYSELGGPLRDLERDVAALDTGSGLGVTGSYLDDLYRSFDGSRGGAEGLFSIRFGAGGVLSAEDEGPLEKKEDESEEEFGRRVRKVNLLSLAQEFAELKKLDAQACPIDHARNSKRSGSLVRAGSDSPRGVSLDRAAGYSRRTQSRSPGRLAGQSGRRGANLREGVAQRAESRSPGRPGERMSMNSSLPRNHEKILEGSSQSEDQTDLPVNEARRRGSSADDLPANMRPGRQHKSGAAGTSGEGGGENNGETDGDFDVYNMESAVPEMTWEMMEKQIQERMRREVSTRPSASFTVCLSVCCQTDCVSSKT